MKNGAYFLSFPDIYRHFHMGICASGLFFISALLIPASRFCLFHSRKTQKSLRVEKLYLPVFVTIIIYYIWLTKSNLGILLPTFLQACHRGTDFRFLVLNRFLHCSLLQLFLVMHLPVVTKVKLAMIRR